MKYENAGQMNFFSEMAEHQISAREFFSNVLLDSLDRNFGLKHVLISYFDTHGTFLSWINRNGILLDCEEPVSYTHLDVYKRQGLPCADLSGGPAR